MNGILDFIFSRALYAGAVAIILLFLGLGLAQLKPFTNRIINNIYEASCFCLCLVWIVVAVFISPHFGYADTFLKGWSDDEKLYLLEETISGSPGEGDREWYHRLYAVDIATGERVFRTYLGNNADLLFLSGNRICYRHKRTIYIMDTSGFNVVKTYDLDELPSVYPQLMPGVSEAKFVEPFFEIDSTSGKRFHLEPLNGGLFEARPEVPVVATAGYVADPDRISRIDPATGRRELLLHFTSVDNSSLSRVVPAGSGKEPFPLELIAPKFLAVYPDERIVLVLSYETTEKKSFLLNALNLDRGAPRWRLKQGDVDTSDYIDSGASLTIAIKHDKDIIINSGGLLVRLNAISGTIIWKKKQ